MATIRERAGKNGAPRYQAVVRIKGQEALRKTFDSKRAAQEWADAMTVAARQSASQLPDTKSFRKITVHEAINAYLQSLRCPASIKSAASSVKRLMPESVLLNSLTHQTIESYIQKARSTPSQYGRPYTDGTILKHLQLLRGAAKHTTRAHRIAFDASIFGVAGISGQWDKERERVMTPDEEKRIREAIERCKFKEHWNLLLDWVLETAARESEAVNLPIDEVKTSMRQWNLPASRTKTRKARDIPLSLKATLTVKRLTELLTQHNQIRATQGLPPENRLFYVFSSPSSVCSGFRKIIKRAQVADLHFHDLRHTAITRMVLQKRKLSVFEIMKMVGHSDIKMLNRYANLRPEDLLDRMD